MELMCLPPYGPDLPPDSLLWFSHIKDKLRGQQFSTADEIVDAFIVFQAESWQLVQTHAQVY